MAMVAKSASYVNENVYERFLVNSFWSAQPVEVKGLMGFHSKQASLS